MAAKHEKKKLFTAFLDLTAAYDSVQREKLWAHLQNIHVPEYLLSAVRALYQETVNILVDRDKVSDEIMATKGLKQGCPLSPLLCSLFTNDLGKFLNTSDHGARAALQLFHYRYCPPPPAPTRWIPHLHDFERADAECALDQNDGLLLLQSTSVSLQLHSA